MGASGESTPIAPSRSRLAPVFWDESAGSPFQRLNDAFSFPGWKKAFKDVCFSIADVEQIEQDYPEYIPRLTKRCEKIAAEKRAKGSHVQKAKESVMEIARDLAEKHLGATALEISTEDSFSAIKRKNGKDNHLIHIMSGVEQGFPTLSRAGQEKKDERLDLPCVRLLFDVMPLP